MLSDRVHPPRESFMVRLWAEPDGTERVLRGSIRNVRTGATVYFDSPELPAGLLRESAERLAHPDDAVPLR